MAILYDFWDVFLADFRVIATEEGQKFANHNRF